MSSFPLVKNMGFLVLWPTIKQQLDIKKGLKNSDQDL
jgi:hypothetical protein